MRIFRVKGLIFVTFLLSIPPISSHAQTNKPPEPPPQATPESVIEQIKKAVVFIQGSYTVLQSRIVNGTRQQLPVSADMAGTGFLIVIPDSRLGADRGYTFLVTNKHMIREPGPTGVMGEGPYFANVFMRINTKHTSADGSQLSVIPLSVVDDKGSLLWFLSGDETVDLAITPVNLDVQQLEYKTIQRDLFATKDVLKKEQINENDEILFAGLFSWSPGVKKNLPIIRHGRLARVLEEPIPLDRIHPEKLVEVHLAEVMSFGGNSGSPVFLRIGGIREGAGGTLGYRYYLLGVMQGFFPEGVDFAIQVAELRGSAAQNSGLAAVVPSDKIMEILDGPRGRAYRALVAANSALELGNPTEAEKLYKDGIEILEGSSPLHSDLASALMIYANFLRKTNRPREAMPLELRVQQIRSNVNTDRMHPRY